jgi:hypothetical protein
MAFQVAVSDAIKRRLDLYSDERYLAFTRAVADIVKGRAQGQRIQTFGMGQREMYALRYGNYTLYFSFDPKIGAASLVIEEFLTDAEGEAYLDVFTEAHD